MIEELFQRHMQGARFRQVDLADADLRQVRLRGARFHEVDFAGAQLRDVNLSGVRVKGAFVDDLEIDGEIGSLRVNGVDVAPLVEAELDRRHPERLKLRPTDAAGFGEAWDVITSLWRGTVERAALLRPELLHEQVDGEWSFIETLRHLAFATDSWVGRVLLGNPSPWHPLGLPWDEMPDTEGVPRDRLARPTLEEALALRADRMAMVRRVVDALTDEELERTVVVPDGPGWPPAGDDFPVREVLMVVLNEEWWHRQFAERDLAVLEAQA
jgi:DinB superfamily/Pentapeptide repeats (8 copies)